MSESSQNNNNPHILPVIHIVTDSVGVTAHAVARAAASQFGITDPTIDVLSKVNSFEDISLYLDEHALEHEKKHGNDHILVFYTLVDQDMKESMQEFLAERPNIVAIDLISDAVEALASLSGLTPSTKPGELHVADKNYFKRIDALEFTIDHDDGRNPQDLMKADIVLIGVSRTSKTPLSIYLAQQGYRVANVPLDLLTEPPKEIFDVEPQKLFGLIITPDILSTIRKRRLGSAYAIASDYADPEYVHQDLEKARALMRKLGCIVVHTDNRAVEETAQEILRYYELARPRFG